MSRTVQATVDVDLGDFDDDELWDEIKARGAILQDADMISDLAHAIEQGNKADALACLLILVRGSAALTEAMERGRRRRI